MKDSGAAKTLEEDLPNRFSEWWSRVTLLYRILELVRFSLLLGLFGVLALFISQGQEVLIEMGETRSLGQMIAFVVCAVFCGLSAWYCARVMFRFRFENHRACQRTAMPSVKKWLPRALGTSVMVLTGVACAWAAQGTSDSGSRVALNWLALAFGLCAATFLIFVSWRRDLVRRRSYIQPVEDEAPEFRRFSDLHPTTRAILCTLLGAGLVVTVTIAYLHWWIGPLLGAASIALLAAALMVPVGSAIVYWGNHNAVPALLLTFLWIVLCGFVADNHRVRQNAEMRSYQDFEPVAASQVNGAFPGDEPLRDYIASWLNEREGTSERADGRVPIVIAAAEGGGIRAAYWTATVLGGLQDVGAQSGINFSHHLFAVSGVSGGSLGGAVFSALSQRKFDAPDGNCAPLDSTDSVRERAHRILDHDFLAPTVAVMLFPDLVQRFSPIAFLDDRGMALEQAWEDSWSDCEGDDVFKAPFLDLWRDPKASQRRPLLFLNSTIVETGQRMLITPFRLKPERFEQTFADAVDGSRVLGDEVSLSTAVHTSARFTYVSPAGTVARDPAMTGVRVPTWFRVVDGGYFENSGAVTASEILRAVRAVATSMSIDIFPIVLHISNEPEGKEEGKFARARKWFSGDNKRTVLPEILSPLLALLNVRPGRGLQARGALASEATAACGMHSHFKLREQGTRIPLGWTLSSLAQTDMKNQLLGYPNDEANRLDNRDRLDALVTELHTGSAAVRSSADCDADLLVEDPARQVKQAQ